MELRQLGSSDLRVSSLCLGTMLFGESTPPAEAERLLGLAADAGVNCFDTAEMYPGRSEEVLGAWLRRQRLRPRCDLVVATKVSGPGGMGWLRGGPARLDGANITAALDASLRRLGTDYVDLLQLHWPDRQGLRCAGLRCGVPQLAWLSADLPPRHLRQPASYVPMFGDLDYDPAMAYAAASFEEQLGALAAAVEAGKVRHVGLSNETPYGLMRFCQLGERSGGWQAVAAHAQKHNAYSLLCRTFDAGLAECCHAERVSLLAYSPLAMGLLTGKYLAAGGGPPDARLNKYRGQYAEAESRYGPKPNVHVAVTAYCRLAADWGLTGASLALRFVLAHSLVASAVVGATSSRQLQELLDAARQPPLDEGLLQAVDAVHRRFPNPTP
ncbi:hypothetical protein CHLNCDRAFT_48407 [Chlorella variabilis]|uniref:NADP-dependent oxidoreductase domain-containing protein n=1 Tax=Chlorella variabilis TaxID=554065 RepID=E1Z2V1_CHLVA|nr:hypothetical protein CHLNCDRAFT_48407 [Chlorella variabilis]EFN60059.1 hypothetical protein CHLNCDRAFT_48407 [Chlorella variabilis]|eukprot:XP_005852161.1 hypothetical protein CHLNCDRAFT_48407 [Chlorella variabilis]